MTLAEVRNYTIQFVSGAVWNVRTEEAPPSTTEGWWKVERMDRIIVKGESGWDSMGTWLINLSNIEGIKDSTPPSNAHGGRK